MLLLCKCLLILLSAKKFGVVNCAPSADAATINDSGRDNAELIVKTKSGHLVGQIFTTLLDQRKFFSFQGDSEH